MEDIAHYLATLIPVHLLLWGTNAGGPARFKASRLETAEYGLHAGDGRKMA